MLERFGVTEETWREGAKKDKNFLESESHYLSDELLPRSQRSCDIRAVWTAFELLGARPRVSITDADGRRRDWGANQDRFLEAPGGVAAASENRFGDPASMVERTDAEDEALLRPVTTLGEPSTYAGQLVRDRTP